MYIFKEEKHAYINLIEPLLVSMCEDLKSQSKYFKDTASNNKVLEDFLILASAFGIDFTNLDSKSPDFIEDFLELLYEARNAYITNKGYSATGIVDKYKAFDKEFWKTYKALQKIYEDFKIDSFFSSIVKRHNYDYSNFLLEKLKLYLLDKKYYNTKKELEDLLVIEKKAIQDSWKKKSVEALDFGTMFHNMKEEYAKSTDYIVHTITKKKYKSINKKEVLQTVINNNNTITTLFLNYLDKYKILDKQELLAEQLDIQNYSLMLNLDLLKNLPDGYYSELLVSLDNRKLNNKLHPDIFIKGQIDKLYIETDTVTGARYVDIGDYKTNKTIKKQGMYLRSLNDTQKLKGVLDYMDDCDLNHYLIQLCLYGYMLEKAGFIVRKMWIENFDNVYNLTYNRDLIEIILKDIDFNTKETLPSTDDLIAMLD
jgi:hypothetical protein